jgi:hypothetical protein
MPSQKVAVNWRGVSFTPTGSNNATSITGVTGVEVDPNGNLIKFSGDIDRYPTTIVNDFIDNMITITAADLAALRSLPPGTRGAMAAIHKASPNQTATTATGDMTYTITGPQGIVQNNPTGGQHRQFGQGRLLVCAESTDGLTNPLATAVT